MSKGIAVETIIKLIVCLIAMAVITYLIYRYVVKSGLSERECAARFTAWCGQCQLANKGGGPWSGGPPMDPGLADCVLEYYSYSDKPGNPCEGFEDKCEGFLPL